MCVVRVCGACVWCVRVACVCGACVWRVCGVCVCDVCVVFVCVGTCRLASRGSG